MKEPLDIKNLIEHAENICTDNQIGFAAEITMPVQDFTDESGTRYQLQLVLTMENIIDHEKE